MSMVFKIAEMPIRVNIDCWFSMLSLVGRRLSKGEGFAMATLNMDHLVKLRECEAFRRAYASHDMVTADGNPIVWMARLAGHRMALIPGSDAIMPLSRLAARIDAPVAMIGTTPSVLERARDHLTARIPKLTVAATLSPPMDFDPQGPEAEALLREVAASGARLCFIAMGAPKQEMLAALGRKVAPDVGFVSVGAGLDFFGGAQRRAPVWVRKIAMEWLWRALSSPCRLGPRYLRCIAILPGEMLTALKQRREPTPLPKAYEAPDADSSARP